MLFSQLVFGAVSAFGAGIFFASFFSSFFILPFLVVGISFLSIFWGRWNMVRFGALFVVAALGMAHYFNAAQLPEPLFEPHQVSFQGRVATFPEKDEQSTKVVVETGSITGKILLFTTLFEEVRQGDDVLVSGQIQSPSVFEDFNYPLYLAKDGIFWVMFHPEVAVQERGKSLLSGLRETLQERIDTFLPSPESSLLAAMLLGNKAGLSEELKGDLNATGTRHITAISGMHVAILSGMLFAFLLNVGVPKRRSSLLVLLFLVFFVVFTGIQTSALRAGIMGSAFLVAGLLGRRNVALRTLVFAGGGMLLSNPLLLRHDVGFQLSFLAVLGILLFLPFLQHFFSRVPNHFGIRDVAFMSIAAQFFTLPLVLHHFGMLSFVALLTNLLIVPLLPLVLLLGILFLVGGLFLPLLAGVFAFVPGLLLSYVAFVVETLSELPFAASQVAGFPLWVLTPLFLFASFFAWRFQQEQKFQFMEQRMI